MPLGSIAQNDWKTGVGGSQAPGLECVALIPSSLALKAKKVGLFQEF
jgi:hypothetical protein